MPITQLKSADQETTAIALLTQANSHLRQQQFWHHLSACSQAPNVMHLATANNHINGIIPVLNQMAATRKGASKADHQDTMEAIFDEFTKAVSTKKAEISENIQGEKKKFAN